MGFIRRSALTFTCFLFLISLLITGSLLTMSISLKYENVQKFSLVITDILENQINFSERVNEEFGVMGEYCLNESGFVFEIEQYVIEIPCDIVDQGLERVIEESVNDAITYIYYQEYDCGFWDCVEKTGSPLFLFSAKAQEYWQNKFYFMLGVSIILFSLIIILVKEKTNSFVIGGLLLIITSFPFMRLNRLLSLILGKYGISLNIFYESSIIFLKLLIAGIIILIIGIILKIFKFGFKVFSKKNEKPKTEKKGIKSEENLRKDKL